MPGETIDWIGVTPGGGERAVDNRGWARPIMAPDMSWLGEPMTDAQAARYEVARVIRHKEAVRVERDALHTKAHDLAAGMTSGNRADRIAAINSLQVEVARVCACGICKEAA